MAATETNINTPAYWDEIYRGEWEAGVILSLRDYGEMHEIIVGLVPPGSSVLDVGCGPGILCRRIAEYVAETQVTGVDFSPYAIGRNAERDAELGVEYLCLDVRSDLGRLESRFDVVTMCEILEHLDDPDEVVAAAIELLRPGGLFILSCPHDAGVPHPEHVREWGHDEIYHLLERHTNSVTFHSLAAPRDRWLLACCRTPTKTADHTDHPVEQLVRLGSPTYRVITSRDRSVEEKVAATHGRFTVFGKDVELERPVDWHQNPFESRSGVYELHTLQFLDVLVRMFLDDADLAALEQAVALAVDWIAGNARDSEEANEFAWYDMAVGLRAPYLAYVLRASASAGVLSEPDAETLLTSLVEHGRYLAAEENYAQGHNHGLFQDEGLLLLCGYLPFLAEAAAWRKLAWARCLQTLRETIEWDEGVQLEHSPAYHLAMTHFVRRLLTLPGADEEMLGPLLSKLEDTAGWLVLPDGTLPELGDTDSIPAVGWAARAAEGKRGLKVLRQSGLAIVKEQDSFLIVTAWYHGRGHKHADELSFMLYEAGQRVIGDAGRYGYYEDEPARVYARSSHAHSALIVDGESFDWRSAKPYGSGILGGGSGAGWHAIEGVNPLLRDADHRRLFLFSPGRALIVVDEVKAEESRSFTRFLHFGPDLDVENSGSGLSLRANGFRSTVSSWADATVDWTMSRGQLEPEIRGWTYPRDRESVPIWTAAADSAGTQLTSAIAVAFHHHRVRVTNIRRFEETVSVSVFLDGSELEIVATSRDGTVEITEEDV